ncbi:MAG: choice-of-anchor D domain-containing protein, partial [Chlorobi bacterium]|nr:choice-of-anchor D domain-containing protein [Chlorobiota bacterium]
PDGPREHIAVVQDTTTNHLTTRRYFDFALAGWKNIKIEFDSGVVSVYDSGALVYHDTIPGFVPFDGYFGFTSATGGGTNYHRIRGLEVRAVAVRAKIASTVELDFGTVDCGVPFVKDSSFFIGNIGTDSLVITSARIVGRNANSYSLLSPVSIPPRLVIQENDTSWITLRFSPVVGGVNTADLIIVSNASNADTFRIALRGRWTPVTVSPANSKIDLGFLCPGESRDTIIVLENRGQSRGRIALSSDTSTRLFPLALDIPAGRKEMVNVTVTAPDNEGRFTRSVIYTDQCGKADTVMISAVVAVPEITMRSEAIIGVKGRTDTLNITIVNTGIRSLTLDSMMISNPVFRLLSPTLPVKISAGDSSVLLVAFTPPDTGSYASQIVVSGSPCDVVFKDSMSAYALGPPHLVATNVVSFPQMICPDIRAIDTTIVLYNPGNSDLHISRIVITGTDAGDYALRVPPSVPPQLLIAAHDSSLISVNFSPSATGLRNAQLEITSDAEGDSIHTIALQGVKDSIGIALSDTLIDFGMLCPGESDSAVIVLANTGTLPATISVTGDSAFTISAYSLVLDTSAVDSFLVIFPGRVDEREFIDTIRFVDDCGTTRLIAFRALVASPAYTWNVPVVDAVVGAPELFDITLTNTGNRNAVITDGAVSDTRFRIVDPPLPWTVAPGDSIRIRLEFLPDSDVTVSSWITIHTGPCIEFDSVLVTANASFATAIISLADVTGGTDDTVGIGIVVSESSLLQRSGARSLRMAVTFNRTLLLPMEIATRIGGRVTVLRNEVVGMDRIFEFSLENPGQTPVDTFAVLVCETGLGNAESTTLTISDFAWLDGIVRTATINGSFTSTGICTEGGPRLIDIPESPSIISAYPNPFNPRTNILFTVPRDMQVQIQVLNALGTRVALLVDQMLKEGSAIAKFDADGLPAGLYFVHLKSEAGVAVLPIVLMK